MSYGSVVHTDMKTDQFIQIQDNPRQRDTEKHAKSAIKKHLKEPSPSHLRVAIATNDREHWKLDGHTRAYLWETGKLEKPEYVKVDIYYVRNRQEAEDLYNCFDNRDAVETTADLIHGSLRSLGIHFESPLLVSHRFKTSIGCIKVCRTMSEYECISMLQDELVELDSWMLPRKINTGIVGYVLLDLFVREHNRLMLREFFTKFSNDEGMKTGKSFDGVYALSEHMKRRQRDGSVCGWSNYESMMDHAYIAVDNYCNNKTMTRIYGNKPAVGNMQKEAFRIAEKHNSVIV